MDKKPAVKSKVSKRWRKALNSTKKLREINLSKTTSYQPEDQKNLIKEKDKEIKRYFSTNYFTFLSSNHD